MGWGQKASILGWRVPTNPTQPSFASYTYFAFGLFVCLFVLYYSLSWVISKKYMLLAWNMRWTCQILQRIILKYVFHPKNGHLKCGSFRLGKYFLGRKWNCLEICVASKISCASENVWQISRSSVGRWQPALPCVSHATQICRHAHLVLPQHSAVRKYKNTKYTNTQIHKYKYKY